VSEARPLGRAAQANLGRGKTRLHRLSRPDAAVGVPDYLSLLWDLVTRRRAWFCRSPPLQSIWRSWHARKQKGSERREGQS